MTPYSAFPEKLSGEVAGSRRRALQTFFRASGTQTSQIQQDVCKRVYVVIDSASEDRPFVNPSNLNTELIDGQ